MSEVETRLHAARQYWDREAASFDQEPDHGLHDPIVLGAWTGLLKAWLSVPQAQILDIGCGTGSLSVVLAGLGHLVSGIDLSPAMISQAERKAAEAGFQISFHVQDASHPQFSDHTYDGIVCRHVLWALPDLSNVLQRWVALLKPSGRLLLIEGVWSTGSGLPASGLPAKELLAALPPSLTNITLQNLSDQPDFWGGVVEDERYAVMAEVNR